MKGNLMNTVHCSHMVFQIREQTFFTAFIWILYCGGVCHHLCSKTSHHRKQKGEKPYIFHGSKTARRKFYQNIGTDFICRWTHRFTCISEGRLKKLQGAMLYEKTAFKTLIYFVFLWGTQKTGAKSFVLDDKMKIHRIYILQKHNTWSRQGTHKPSWSDEILHLPVPHAISFFF